MSEGFLADKGLFELIEAYNNLKIKKLIANFGFAEF